MNPAEAIKLYHPFLFTIAYKIVGTTMDAEDVVQNTYLNWLSTDTEKVDNPKSYLTRSVINQSINYLNELRKQKQEEWSTWLQHSVFDKYAESDMMKFDFQKEIREQLSAFLQKLTPAERAVYLLKEVFNFGYQELSEIFERNTDHCRQLLSRARVNLTKDKKRFPVDAEKHEEFYNKFMHAWQGGGPHALIELLKKDLFKETKKEDSPII